MTDIQGAVTGLTVPTSGTGSLTITGTPTAIGTETFTVTATDSLGATATANYSITVDPALTLTPATLPADTVGVAYNQTLTGGGGTGAVTLAVSDIQNAIPGLTVPTSGPTGSLTITGTPTAAGTETFVVAITDSLGATTTANYSITANPLPSLAPATLPADTIDVAYNQTLTASGGTGTVGLAVTNIQGAVPGLTVPMSGTGSLAISGTPTAAGSETFTVTATDSLGATTTTNYSITVNPALSLAPATLPADTAGVAYNQTIAASGGTGTLALAVTNITGAIAGLTVPMSGTGSLAISGTPTAAGTETFTLTATDSVGATTTTTYSITVNPALSLAPATLPANTVGVAYNQTVTADGGTGTVGLAVSNIQGAVPGLTVPMSGTGSLVIGGTPTAAGTETFTLTATDSFGTTTTANYSITVNAAPGLAHARLCRTGSVSAAYTQTITASGGTGTVTLAVSDIQNAIPGLTVPAGGTGSLAISGTPTATGTETFTVTATDSLGATTTANYTITVDPELTLTPATLPANTVGVAYNQTITGGGGTGTVTLSVINIQGAIPGLTVPASGAGSLTITGTPTAAGTETFIVAVTDSLGATIAENYSITVNPATGLAPATLPADTIGLLYNQMITAGGGTGTVMLAVSNIQNAIPGLTVPASGTGSLVIGGTPTAAGTETFTLTATDSLGATTTTDYSITVNSATGLSPATLSNGATGAGLQPDDHRRRRHGHALARGEQHPKRNPRLDRSRQRHGKPHDCGHPDRRRGGNVRRHRHRFAGRDNHGQLQHRGQLGAASQ